MSLDQGGRVAADTHVRSGDLMLWYWAATQRFGITYPEVHYTGDAINFVTVV